MTDTAHSMKLKSLYIARFLLEASGVLLIIWAAFSTVVSWITPRGFHGEYNVVRAILADTVPWVCGIGLLLPQQWAKLLASLVLAVAGALLFRIDDYRWNNLTIYCLFITPLLLTLWLRKGLSDFALRRLPNAN
jgi:hypothetical protein